MDLLIILTYAGVCIAVFKVFKIPLNKWTVPTAMLGGIVLIATLLLLMNYNHPYTKFAREYFVSVPIVPAVKGVVVDVEAEPNQPLKQGDVLFRIDPTPFEYEVQRLEAMLADASAGAAQLEERYIAAQAATKQALAEVRAAESELDRQAREALEQARAAVATVQSRYDFAEKEEQRYRELVSKGTISRERYDRSKQTLDSLKAQLDQARAAQRQASEKLSGGGDRIQSTRERLSQAGAQEREARLAFEAESGGQNPQVQRISAELGQKRWELEQATVRAPSDGYVTQMALRPGMMAASLPLRPVMIFVPKESAGIAGAFWQNSLLRLEPGVEAEAIIPAIPGRVFKGKIKQVLPAISEGEIQAGGTLQSGNRLFARGRSIVIIELDDDLSEYRLPSGFSAEVAVYTEHFHHVAVMRKVLLRVNSWLNYVFGDH